MAGSAYSSEGLTRGVRMLRTALGPVISRLLDDPTVVEVMLNPDGGLWVDRLAWQGLPMARGTSRVDKADSQIG